MTLVWSLKRESSNPRQVLSPRGNSVQEKWVSHQQADLSVVFRDCYATLSDT